MRARVLVVLVLGVVALAVAGCGGGEETSPTANTVEGTAGSTETTGTTANPPPAASQGDAVAGKKVFVDVAGCGSCHTLEAAGTNGTVGPNLDDAKPPRDLIIERVTNGKSPMPSFKDSLSQKQIQDVAAFVFQSTHGGG
jgi:cytochrome c6